MISEETVSVTAWVYRWIREHVEKETDRVELKAVMPDLVADFKQDKEMVDRFLEEELYNYAAQSTRKLLAKGRGPRAVVQTETTIQTVESFDTEADTRPDQFSQFWEYWVNASATYFRLPRMNRAQLQTSILEDRTRLKTQRIHLLFKEKIATQLPNDESVVVEDVLSDEQLQDLYAAAKKEIGGER